MVNYVRILFKSFCLYKIFMHTNKMCLLLSSESALLPYKSVSNVGSHSGDTCEHYLAKFVEPIAFKQVMFGSFISTTVAQRTVYDIFRLEMGI